MAADANLFQAYLQPPKTVLDYTSDLQKADMQRQQLAQGALTLQQGQLTLQQAANVSQQRNAFRDLVSGGADLNDPTQQARALSVAPDVAPALLKTIQEGKTSAALASKDTSIAGENNQKVQIAAHQQHLQALSTVQTPQDAVQWMVDGVKSGVLPAQGLDQGMQRLQQAAQDPQAFAQWRQSTAAQGMTVQQQMEMTNAKPTEVRLGNVVKTIDMNPRSASFGKEVVQSQAIGVSPDTTANNQTSLATTGMNNATSRANNAANIGKDYAVAGMNPDGTAGTANQSIVDAIGQYKVAPPNGMALRNPRMQQILADVTAKYPDFDATTYGGRQSAAKSFSTGPLAQNVQAGNTALNHLETIKALAEAQANGNIPLFNQLANAFGTQTGQPAPTNLKAAITMVAPEITKAVVGAGGSVGDREHAAQMLNPNASPAQIAGSVGTVQELFGGRLAEVARTYQRSTGRSDFADTYLSPAAQKVLAAKMGSAPAAHPADITNLLNKYGTK